MTKTTTTEQVPTAEAARVLGVSVWSIRRLIERGELEPTAKLPGLRGAYLFDRADVDRLAAERAS